MECLEDRFAPAGIDLNPTIDFQVDSAWNTGYQASLAIINDQGEDISDWQLAFDYTHEIDSIWNAEIVEQDGNNYVVSHNGWNSVVGDGLTVSFGFTGNSSGTPVEPVNYVLSWGVIPDDPGGPGAGDVAVDFAVTSDWQSGFGADISISNQGTESISSWTLEFDFPHDITSIWNARIVSHEGDHYTIADLGWNGGIAPGATVSFGFNGTPGNVGNGPTNYILNGVPLDGGVDPLPSLAISDASATEEDSGDTLLSFTVELSEPAADAVTVDYATQDGTAQAGADYSQASGTLIFAPGETQMTVDVVVHGDLVDEPDETLSVALSNATGATLADASATGTIIDNDAPPPTIPDISISNATVVEGDTQAAAGFFHTSGNQIVDAGNQPVRIAGINWFGLETTNYAPHGLWARNYRDMMDQMKELGFNTIRLAFSNELFDPGTTPNGIDFGLNPDLAGLSGLEIMDKVVEYAGQIGLRIILDNHRLEAGSGAGSGLWYSAAIPESRWIADWEMLAQRYAGNPTIIGADLHNEPHGAATWGTGDQATDWRLAAERAGNAVLAENSDWLIFVEGIEFHAGSNYWWGGNLAGARDFPVRLDVADRLVYSPHAYPASVFHQTWFDDASFPDNLPAIWDQHWGYLFRENIAPVMLGEFGSKLDNPLDEPWVDTMIEYLRGDLDGDGTLDLNPGELGISWTWWSWNPNSGDTGGILMDDWTTVDSGKLDKLLPVQFSFAEGGTQTAVFTVTLSEASQQTVTVDFATADGAATQGSDYVPTSGTLTFAPGETQKAIAVSVIGDTDDEPNESFLILLTGAANAAIADGEGAGTILDDDATDPGDPADKRVVAYFAEWSIYDRGYQVADIPADQLTHVIYAFANISPTGEVILFDQWAAVDKPFPGDDPGQPIKGNFNQLQLLKEENPHLKTLIAVGGWTLSGEFSNVALTEESRQLFAESAVDFVVQYGFDGIDLDWEYPVGGGLAGNAARPEDKQNYTLLVEEIREQLDAQEAIDGNDYLLTVATPAGFDKIVNFELGNMSQYVDWFNVMAYDYHGAWENVTNHQAPLYASPNDPSSLSTQYNVDWTIQAYLSDGVAADKILMGLPLYTRGWQGVGPTSNGLYQPAAGAAQGTFEPGNFDYRDIYDRLQTQPDLYTEYWDDLAGVPYVYAPSVQGGLFSTYENAQSIQGKIDYVKQHDLGGVFFWELSGDIRDSSHPDSLVNIAANELLGPATPQLSVSDLTITEGDNGTQSAVVNVSLSIASDEVVTVDYSTSDGTAQAGSDYQTTSGTLTFAPGSTTGSIVIPVLGDDLIEGNETFGVMLTDAVHAAIGRGDATVTIADDDAPPANVSVELLVRDDWGSGFVADLIITNHQAAAITDWTLEFDFDHEIASMWNAEIVSHVGNHYVIQPASWNATIAAGGSVTVGFQGAPGNVAADLVNVLLNDEPVGEALV